MYERRRGSSAWRELGECLSAAGLGWASSPASKASKASSKASVMPRVVEDQESLFHSSAFFALLARPNDVRYTSIPHAPEAERQQRFLQELQEGRLPVTVVETGLNLELHVLPALQEPSPASTANAAVLSHDGPQVRVSSRLILNGVCVRWRGWLDRFSLKGQGRLEFDPLTAQAEEVRMRAESEVLEALHLDMNLFALPPLAQVQGAPTKAPRPSAPHLSAPPRPSPTLRSPPAEARRARHPKGGINLPIIKGPKKPLWEVCFLGAGEWGRATTEVLLLEPIGEGEEISYTEILVDLDRPRQARDYALRSPLVEAWEAVEGIPDVEFRSAKIGCYGAHYYRIGNMCPFDGFETQGLSKILSAVQSTRCFFGKMSPVELCTATEMAGESFEGRIRELWVEECRMSHYGDSLTRTDTMRALLDLAKKCKDVLELFVLNKAWELPKCGMTSGQLAAELGRFAKLKNVGFVAADKASPYDQVYMESAGETMLRRGLVNRLLIGGAKPRNFNLTQEWARTLNNEKKTFLFYLDSKDEDDTRTHVKIFVDTVESLPDCEMLKPKLMPKTPTPGWPDNTYAAHRAINKRTKKYILLLANPHLGWYVEGQ